MAEPPPGITVVSFLLDDVRQTKIALECRPPESLGSTDSLIATPWSGATPPKQLFYYHDGRWRRATDIGLRGGMISCRGSSVTKDLPEIEEWFDSTTPEKPVGFRAVTKELSESRQKAKQLEAERLQEEVRELESQIQENDLKIEELELEMRDSGTGRSRVGRRDPRLDQRDPRELRRRRREVLDELRQLKSDQSRLRASLEAKEEQAPECDIEYLQFSGIPESEEVQKNGYVAPGRELISTEGSLHDLQLLLKHLEPDLDSVQAWIDLGSAPNYSLNAEGSLIGAPVGTQVEIRPSKDARKLFTSKSRAGGVSSSGSFSLRTTLSPVDVSEPQSFELEFFCIGKGGNETKLGSWSAVLLPRTRRTPFELIDAEDHLPWRLKPRETRIDEAPEIPIASSTDHPVGGILHDIAATSGGRILAAAVVDQSRLKYFDTWEKKWSSGPEFEAGDREVLVAADARRVFVLDQDGKRLRSISQSKGEVLAKSRLDGPILDIAAGHSSVQGPLAILTPDFVELRDPVTLKVLNKFWPTQDRSLPPVIENRLKLPIRNSNEKAESGHLRAAPDSSSFSVHTQTGGDRIQTEDFILYTNGLLWRFEENQNSPGWLGTQYNSSSLTRPDSRESVRIQIENFSIRDLMPTLGTGHLCFTSLSSATLPAAPLQMAYFADETSHVQFSGAALAQNVTDLNRDRIWFDPARACLITAGDSILRLEILDADAFQARMPPASRITVPEVASPGNPWNHTLGKIGDSVGLNSTNPEAEVALENGTLSWDVPENFPAAALSIELTVAGESVKLDIPVGGGQPVGFLPESGVPTKVGASVLTLGQIDRLISIPDSTLLIAVRNGGCRLTLLDIEKYSIVRDLWLPGGTSSVVISGETLYLCYPEMGIMETRKLSDLTPISARPYSFDLPFKGISAAPNSPLRAILAQSFHKIEIVELDEDTMTPTESSVIDGPRLGDNNSLVNINTSPDGSIIVVENSLLRLEESQWKEVKLPSEVRPHSEIPLTLGPDSFNVYSHTGMCDIDTGRAWQPSKEEPRSIACGPANKPGYFLVARMGAADYSIEIRDTDRKDLLATVTNLTEFTFGRDRVVAAQIMERIIYLPEINTLITIGLGDQDLIIRKLPPLD